MNRIASTFQSLEMRGKKALVPYITPEFPFAGATLPILQALAEAGANLIEVGIPFSDPLADGGTIQRSSEIAISNGATIPKILERVEEFRKKSEIPIVLMGYYNPIYHYGVEKFCRESYSAGVDGVIVPDLPPEEAGELRVSSQRNRLSNIFLIAPTTADARIHTIDEASTDFSYCVSVTGVTGVRDQFESNGSLEHFLGRVKSNAKKKFVVGFGISRREQVERVWQYADGAVVGSALIQAVAESKSSHEAATAARVFVKGLLN